MRAVQVLFATEFKAEVRVQQRGEDTARRKRC